MSPKRNVKTSPPRNEPPIEFPKKSSPPMDSPSPPKCKVPSPPLKVTSPPTVKNVFTTQNQDKEDNAAKNNYITLSTKVSSPPKTDKLTSFSGGVLSNIQKFNRVDSKNEDDTAKVKKEVAKEMPLKTEKLSLPAPKNNDTKPNVTEPEVKQEDKSLKAAAQDDIPKKVDTEPPKADDKSEENNGVGDKIRIFEKAAEDASANAGRLSRPGSVRGRSRTERLGSDSDLPPPATPFKDNIFFENNSEKTNTLNHRNTLERQPSITGSVAAKWQRNDSSEEKIQKPEPQKIIKPEFKPMPSPVDLTIRSPSLGAKIPDQFPSQGTAFRNVASPDTARTNANKAAEDLKAYKLKNKQKLSVSKGTSYFSSVSNEVWLVKKKDIEEIEERVLDSFRRAGGNVCMRSETMRPSSDSGQSAFTHATMGRKRQMYARSESLDPQWANARAQTLKRQSSVACTCGHDKKTKGKSAETPRPRSRSHGDENNQSHVLDKYETLV
ncbi:uncharacterized protein LOC121735251 [Aricia agestis]|uniref:uncharacterized protein LOC121735251 n=1 Tax=Aricia agestis TaxID=91739 RepID=UPI001C207873|nr:uncharacterized protein LOC121735251 [Aricia agestis]